MEDTIVAYATPPGISGVAVLRLSGDDSLDIVERIFTPGPLPGTVADGEPGFGRPLRDLNGYQAALGWLHRPDDEKVIDQAIVTRFKAPNSYTGENVFELSVHGGAAVRRSLLHACLDAGARLADAGEFTKRAFINGKIDLAQSEAVMDLIEADAGRAMEVAMRQLQGGLSRQIHEYVDLLYSWLSTIEVGMEYPEYEDSSFQNEELLRLLPMLGKKLADLEQSFTQGRILKEGLQVVIAGRPNAGKSSLLNYLVGEDRSIVTHIAGTTRDTVDVDISVGGIPLRLTDTAGLRISDDPVEQIGIERATKALSDADVVLWLLDGDVLLGLDSFGAGNNLHEDVLNAFELKQINDAIGKGEVYFVLTKQDISSWTELRQADLGAQLRCALPAMKSLIATSSMSGEGVNELRAAMTDTYEQLGSRSADLALLTSERHRDAIRRARAILDPLAQMAGVLEPVIVASQLKATAEALSVITGETVSEHLINELFSRFCIGK